MKSRFHLLLSSIALTAVGTMFGSAPTAPKLVLQITVDQLRGDLPARFGEHFGEGGFRYLLDQGVVFKNAHHAHANTETIVGHTTLSTGAHPAAHGMVGNVWFDRTDGRLVYNVEDERFPLLSADADVDDSTEIDPTQRTANSDGRSPANIAVSTFADELVIHHVDGAKAFGVSVKDRGAIAMAGHAGKAFWFSKQAGEFVTSRFYYDAYPTWVTAFNATGPAQRYANTHWELMHDRDTYRFADRDDQPWETDFPGYGRTFPHAFGDGTGKYYTTLLTVSPAGDELVLDFAQELIVQETIGQDDVTDYLSVSFSSTDYVGHLFGPSSLEAEDNIRRLDRTLAQLLAFVDEKVGLDQTLVVLSADHGGPDAPGFVNQYGVESALIDPDSWDKTPAFNRLKERFGIGEELIQTYFHPYVYLNKEAIAAAGLDLAEVESAVAAELLKLDGIAAAFTYTDLMRGSVPDTRLTRKVLHNHNPQRSGEIFVVFAPNRFIADFDGLHVASTHGSPWAYDSFVPIIFAGYGLESTAVHRRVHTVDIAPTLATLVGTKPPSGAAGDPLPEVVGQLDPGPDGQGANGRP